jgi:TetR/AcrR family transcriptional regulator, copper-responsive repressor
MVQKPVKGERKRGRPRGFDPEAALDRARDAFWNTGYAATSLDDISAATGLNRPSLYGAFGDKQALYLAALQKSRSELNAALSAAMAPEEPLRAALGRVYSAAAQIYAQGELGQRGCFLIGTAVTEAVADPEIRQTLDQALAEVDSAFASRMRRAQTEGELAADADVDGLAKLATATLNGMAVRARAGGDQASLTAFGDALIGLICGPS